MKSFYKVVSIATSALFVYLFTQLFFFSDSFVLDLGLEPSATTLVLARRTSMFMLGIAILMLTLRNLPTSKVRQAVCLSVGATMLGLACMGTYELLKGSVNSSILVAIAIESFLWISYAIVAVMDRKQQV